MNDVVCYEVISIDSSGIIVKNGQHNVFICFEECAKNYASEHSIATSKCVATRDIANLTFVFYTIPKTRLIFKKTLKSLLTCKFPTSKFIDLKNAINKYGYASYDLS